VQREICEVTNGSDHGIGSGDTSLISRAMGKPTGRPGRNTKLILPRGNKKSKYFSVQSKGIPSCKSTFVSP
jgi:hypothetical protein